MNTASKPEFADHLLDGEQASDQRVAFEPDAKLAQVGDFRVDHGVGQAEVRNAVAQHAAGQVERFIHRDVAAGLRHVGGAGHAGGAGADDADAEAVGVDVRLLAPALGDGSVADPAFQPADRHRFQRFADGADALALVFLRADAAADRGQQVGASDHVVGAAQVFRDELLDEAGDVDADRAAGDAGRVGAHQAAVGFAQRLVRRCSRRSLPRSSRARSRGSLLADRRAVLRDGAYRLLLRHLRHAYATRRARTRGVIGHRRVRLDGSQRQAACLASCVMRRGVSPTSAAQSGHAFFRLGVAAQTRAAGRRNPPGGRRSPGRRRRRTSPCRRP